MWYGRKNNPRRKLKYWQKPRRELPCSYGEHRGKVTLRSFLAQRYIRAHGIEGRYAEQWALLMSSPIHAPRLSLRDQCPFSADKLASKAAKYLTLATEYAHRRAWDKARHQPIPQSEPFGGRCGYGDTKAAKAYHERRVAEYRAAQEWKIAA